MNKPMVHGFRDLRQCLQAALAFLFTSTGLLAAPYFGEEAFTYRQPDGETFQVRLYGDEFFAYEETEDGYLVIRDPNSGILCYAKTTPDGSDIVSTGVRVGQAKPVGLKPKERMSGGKAMEKGLVNRNLLGADDKGRRNHGKKLKVGKGGAILNVPIDETAPQAAPAAGDGSTTGTDPVVLPSPPPAPTLNQRVGLVLLASFPDRPADITKTVSQIDNYCNAETYTVDGNATSVYGYFKMQSNGKLSYKNNVTAWFTAANPRSYYTDNTVAYATRAKELIKEGLTALKAKGFDFTQCDGNNDGKLDGVNCFYAGVRVNTWSQGIWPHQSGTSWTGLTGTGISNTSFDYQITDMPASLPIGTFCHENGHMICDFPDLYAYESGGLTNAANLGSYSLMASSGSTHPRHVDAYLKIHAGWADVVDLTSASQQLCAVQQDRNFFYRYKNPAKPTEYFIFEVRGTAGYEGVWNGAAATNPANGLVIYHALQLGSNTSSTIFTADAITNYTKPYELMVVEAAPSTTVVPWYDDPTPGTNDAYSSTGVSSISDSTTPVNLKFWAADGRTLASGANINTISAAGQTMTFIAGGGALPATPATNVTATQFQPNVDFGGNAANQTFSVFNGGGGTLSYTVTDDVAWLACAPAASGTATTEADLITVSYTTSALAVGTHTATITIDGGAAGIQTIPVTLTVNTLPILTSFPSSISITGLAGSSNNTANFYVGNSGGGTASYSITKTQSWLSLDRTSGTVDSEQDLITATLNATGLSAGVYTDTITVTSSAATNSPLTIPVTFTVLSTDMIVTSPNGGEQWVRGETRSITWISSLGGNVKIELFKGAVFDSTIVASTPNTGSYSWTITGAQAAADYTVKITSIETPAKTDSSDANFTILSTLADALDTSGPTWTTTGNQLWLYQSANTHDGADAAQSGAIGDSQSSSIETAVTGPGTLTFWWKVSSEYGWDYLRFYLNGVEQAGAVRISGTTGSWAQKTISIPAGSQTIKWTYSKDSSNAAGSDAAWVDEVIFTPVSAPEIAVEQPVGTNLTDGSSTINLGSIDTGSSSSPITFTVKNNGTADLTGLAITKDGTNNADYTVSALGATTLAPAASTTFTVAFSPGAAGSLTAAIHIASNDSDENPFDINLTGTGIGPGTLAVTPAGGLTSSGICGGSFSPASIDYTLSNPGGTAIDWTAENIQSWVTLSAVSGTLAAGASTTVTASINSNANTFNVGSYSDTVTFTNTTSGTGNTTRAVDLTVNPIPVTVSLSNLLQIYNGSPKPVTVTTSPTPRAYSVTYDGSSTVPTTGGTYAVVATVTEANHAGSANGNLVIAYNVTYLGNGNTGGGVPADQTKYQNVDLTLATNTGSLIKSGYSLVGWNTAADGSGTSYPLGSSYTANANLTLYAQWITGTYLTWDANGATATQTNGAGTWLNASQWWDGTTNQTWSSGAFATFGGPNTAGGAVTLASPTTIDAITFNQFTGTYTLGTIGQAITLNNGITKNSGSAVATFISPLTLGGAQTWTNNSSTNLNVQAATTLGGVLTVSGTGTTSFDNANAVISGAGGIIKNGTSQLNLSGGATPAHTFTGDIIVNGGSIGFQVSAFLTGRNVKLTNGYLGGRYGSGFTWTGGLGTGANQIQITGGTSGFSGEGGSNSAFQIGTALSTLTWGATDENGATGYFNPTVFLANGDARMNPGGMGSLNNGIDLNGTTRTITSLQTTDGGVSSGFTIKGVISNSSGTAGLIKTGVGNLILAAANTYNGDTTISGGSLQIGNNTTGSLGNGTYNSNISIASGSTLRIYSSASQTLGGIISGAGGLKKAYAGTLTLSGPNTYSGRTSFLPQSTAGFTVNITSFNSVNGGTPLMASSSLGAPTTIANGTIDFGDGSKQASVNLNYTGPGETTDRVINFGFNGTASCTLTASGSGLLKFTSAMTGNAITTQSGKLILDGTGSGEITQTLPALPSGGLTKNGTGTWTLSGANSYTGITTVSLGKLLINGDQGLATGNVSVAAAATLGGTGIIGGNTTIAATGKLEFDLSTNAASHNKLELAAGKTLTFSGASVLTITSPGGAQTGSYTLLTAPGGISGVAPATLNLPATWAATVSIVGNDLVLNVTSVGNTAVDHFAISSIASPQTVGTPITGITLTAQTASNQTATSFTGTVIYGGTAGITGTSASFVNGVLTGVSVTPTVAGTGLTLTVDDGAAHTGSTVFTVLSVFDHWASVSGLSGGDAIAVANPDGDSLTNLQEFAFGTNPSLSVLQPLAFEIDGNVTTPGVPVLMNFSSSAIPDYRAVFARRKDRVSAGLVYAVEFSADMVLWTPSATAPTVLTNVSSVGDMEAVSVPYPATIPEPKFFRVTVE